MDADLAPTALIDRDSDVVKSFVERVAGDGVRQGAGTYADLPLPEMLADLAATYGRE